MRVVHKVIFDSNIFVAAAFNRRSASARLVNMAREGLLRMMWHGETRAETRLQLQKIPPISWEPFADLFVDENKVPGMLDVAAFTFVDDRDDRKFAALAVQAGATLVTNDGHLLDVAKQIGAPVVTPGQLLESLT